METNDIDTLNLLSKLEAIETAMPKDLGGHIGAIHKILKSREELVHILTDEQVRSLVSAQIKYTGVALIDEAVKSRAKKGKLTEDDLF